MYYVYRFLDKYCNVIYVGKTKQDLRVRFKAHQHLPNECYKMVHKIEYIECNTESDMSIKEIYYINKFHDNAIFFNILDMSAIPQAVHFNDKWLLYKDELNGNFCNSINFRKKYKEIRESHVNKDGSVSKAVSHKQKGISSFVEGFTTEEADRLTKVLIKKVLEAENQDQEKFSFRNLVMFVLGMNLPIRPNKLLEIKYRDLFTEKDRIKPYELRLARAYKDEVIQFPLPNNVKEILMHYVNKYGLNYKENADGYLFMSRKNQVITVKSLGRIIMEAVSMAGIAKKAGGESLRKTYGLNIYNQSENKLEALIYLEHLWGQVQYGQLIDFLGLYSDKMNCKKFFCKKFWLCKTNKHLIELIKKI